MAKRSKFISRDFMIVRATYLRGPSDYIRPLLYSVSKKIPLLLNMSGQALLYSFSAPKSSWFGRCTLQLRSLLNIGTSDSRRRRSLGSKWIYKRKASSEYKGSCCIQWYTGYIRGISLSRLQLYHICSHIWRAYIPAELVQEGTLWLEQCDRKYRGKSLTVSITLYSCIDLTERRYRGNALSPFIKQDTTLVSLDNTCVHVSVNLDKYVQ
jgi:hypothetical protein